MKQKKRNISGWINFNKPYDMSSTQAVNKLRWLFNAKKAGHAGTLDPLATGILPIAFGEATKTISFVQDAKKNYHFSIIWGKQTNTDDREGEIIATSDFRPTKEQILSALPDFTGKIEQIPPTFSAIKIKGERAYDLARAGEKITMKPREIFIDSFKLINHKEHQSCFEVICEKGTYVRALARDLALKLGTRGHVGELHRVAVGDFSDNNSVDIEQIENADLEQRDKLLLPVSAALTNIPEIILDARQTQLIRQGNPVLLSGTNAPIKHNEAWASHKGQVIALGFVEKGQFKPKRVILNN